MSTKPTNSLHHPIEFQFIGQAGDKIFEEDITDKGFVVHHAVIQTAGFTNEDVISTPIKLITPKTDNDILQSGDYYSMTCKLIASNDSRADHLHFDKVTRLDVASVRQLTNNDKGNTVNRVYFRALGTIMEKEITDGILPGGPRMANITLKSVDIDPVTGSPVVWLTKHRMSPLPSMACAKHLWNVGSDVHLSGMVVGYDTESSTWISDVSCLSACDGPPQTHSIPVGSGRSNVKRLGSARVNKRNWRKAVRAYNARRLHTGATIAALQAKDTQSPKNGLVN